jgi:UDP-4-amino-4,6-dideoxy-N-acetyl-beta-L-altrosamine transaminase
MIPYGRQDITQADIDSVVSVLTSDFLTQGPQVDLFERAIATHCGVSHAVAVNSATSALHIACLALGLGPGDRLWTSPITFVASANCALYCGASVDFVDIDPRTYNLSVDSLAEKLEQAERDGTLPKIVVPVHLTGQPCDMEAIHTLSKKYGFSVIEDASHAIGARYQDDPVGSCRYSDICVFSFHPVKIVTTAEGGVATTNNAELARKLFLLRTHGITRDPSQMHGVPHGPWYYEQIDLGFNYRMTDIQAALGSSQMSRLDEYVKRRHDIAVTYYDRLSQLPIQLPWQSPRSFSAYHLYVIRVDSNRAKISRTELFARLRESGVGVNLHYIPVPRHPFYAQLGFRSSDFPAAESYYEEAISLPMFPMLSDEQIDTVVNLIQENV